MRSHEAPRSCFLSRGLPPSRDRSPPSRMSRARADHPGKAPRSPFCRQPSLAGTGTGSRSLDRENPFSRVPAIRRGSLPQGEKPPRFRRDHDLSRFIPCRPPRRRRGPRGRRCRLPGGLQQRLQPHASPRTPCRVGKGNGFLPLQ